MRGNPDIAAAVSVFYKANFWSPHLDQMPQEIANWLFDCGVNCGMRQANKFVQRALGVPDDGILGPQTIQAVNQSDSSALVAKCREHRIAFYKELVAKNPSQAQFLDGWIARA
jgi:lysozyme family protein